MVRLLLLGLVCVLAVYLLVSAVGSPWIVPQSSKQNTWTLVLGGDAMLGRSITITALDQKKNAFYPFLEIASAFKEADLSLVNLENPVVEKCPRRSNGMVFCAPPQMLEGLTLAGIDVVNLANNHARNYGSDGYEQTKQHLSRSNIDYSDSNTMATKTIAETTVGFIGFDKSQQSNPLLSQSEESFVLNSSKQVDVLVVSMHWGVEYHEHPTDGQRKLAQQLVSLGADVVVGHHPHWIQDTENINGVPVYYSLGNLVFDQAWSEPTKKGLVVKLTFNGSTLTQQELFHTYMKNFTQPSFVDMK